MSRDQPVKNEKFIWTPGNNLGTVFLTVKTIMIRGARPRVTFNCTTGRDQWLKTMKYPLIHTIQEHEWTEEDVREARRSDGAHPEGLAVQPTPVHLHGLPPTAVESRP